MVPIVCRYTQIILVPAPDCDCGVIFVQWSFWSFVGTVSAHCTYTVQPQVRSTANIKTNAEDTICLVHTVLEEVL